MEGSRGGVAAAVVAVVAFLLALVMLVALIVAIEADDQACLPAVDAPTGVDVPAEPVAVTSTGAPLTARVASWNTLFSNSTGRVLDGLHTIAATADVIGVQELSSPRRRDDAARAMAKLGWGVSAGNNAVKIFYDASKYKLLAQGSEKVIDVVRIESGTAGTSIGPKAVQWVQLQDRATGAVLFVVNHHIVPDIDRKGHPRRGAPKRLSVYRTQMAAMLSVVSKLRAYGPVAVTGDHNVDARADQKVKNPTFPYVVMAGAGLASNWAALGAPKRGTQTSGHRLIDYVWLTQANGRFLGQKILGAYGSDHHAVVALIANRTSGQPATTPASQANSQARLPTSLTVPGWKLDADQITVAATAIEVGQQLGVPQRGWVVAIAAALTESGLRNLDHGDRDSVNPWQMRPSTGWGTKEQLMQLNLAARAFYGLAEHTNNPGLLDITGWEQMSIGQAAQAVEVSAHPDRYDKNEAAARAVVAQLAGLATGTAVAGDPNCPTPTLAAGDVGNCPATTLTAEKGLTPDALRVLRCIRQQFPQITDIGGVRADALPDHPSGRAVDLMIPDYQSANGKAFGWTVARWLQAHQKQLGIQYLIFDNKIWNIKRDDQGWRVYHASAQGSDSELHYNHVHVTVFGNKAMPDGPGEPVAAGAWQAPISAAFPARCGFHGTGCGRPYPSHTGQDFPAPPGTPVYAVTNGTVVRSESLLASGGTCTTLPICGGTKRSYGNLLVIQVAGGGQVTAWYAHLTERRVRVGDAVRTGQIIGTVGYQGHVEPHGPGGAHLHFEIRRKGNPIEPMRYLRTQGIQL